MLKVDLIDHEVEKAMKGDEALSALVKKTEVLLGELIDMNDVYINNISDKDMKVINDSINISKDILVLFAREREAIFTILKNQEELMDAIKNINNKIDNLKQTTNGWELV